MCVGYEVRGKK